MANIKCLLKMSIHNNHLLLKVVTGPVPTFEIAMVRVRHFAPRVNLNMTEYEAMKPFVLVSRSNIPRQAGVPQPVKARVGA